MKYATKDQACFGALVEAQLGHIKTEIDDAAARGDVPAWDEHDDTGHWADQITGD